MAIAETHARLGRQLDSRLFIGFCLASCRGSAAYCGRQLCTQPKPMPCPFALCRPWWQELATAGSTRRRKLRLERRRLAGAWAVLGYDALAGVRVFTDAAALNVGWRRVTRQRRHRQGCCVIPLPLCIMTTRNAR